MANTRDTLPLATHTTHITGRVWSVDEPTRELDVDGLLELAFARGATDLKAVEAFADAMVAATPARSALSGVVLEALDGLDALLRRRAALAAGRG